MAVTSDAESPDADNPAAPTSGPDLTPREVPAAAPAKKGPAWAKLAGAVVVLAIGAVVVFGLRDATVFFKFVDEAVAQKSELGTRFFRMQGDVVKGSVQQTDDGATFTMRHNGVTAKVVHHGPEPALFGDPRIPVVVEGHWKGGAFQSDRIIVNHDNSYKEKNGDRLRTAEADAAADAGAAASTTAVSAATTAP